MGFHVKIETLNEGNTMQNRHKKKRSKDQVKTKSEYNSNRFFHETSQCREGVNQVTQIDIKINPDPEPGCWDAIKSCVGLAAKGAASGG